MKRGKYVIVAERKLIMRGKDREEREIHIKIGRPYEVSKGEAACPLAIDGLYGRLPDIRGVDTFQALGLAMKFVQLTLKAWEKKGAVFLISEDGKEYPGNIDAIFGESRCPSVIGIAGASCAGKTALAEALARRLGSVKVLAVDHYYQDLSHLSFEERALVNFDEPAAIDHELLIEHVRRLREGLPVEQPVYDFTQHARKPETKPVGAAGLLIVEGLLALYWPELRALYSASVFISAPDGECLARRTARDVRDRGRTPESVRAQFERTVRPMYERHCAETRRYADLVLDGRRPVEELADAVVGMLREKGLVLEE